MNNLFIAALLSLLALCLCSCSNDSAVDCSSLQTTNGTATLKVTPTGDSSYTVQGVGMDGVAGIQLSISYDSASLADPTVTQGEFIAGAMLASNTSQPGLIKIAIISTKAFSGSGQIASITFASKNGAGGITSITTSMIDNKGTPLSSQTSKIPASGHSTTTAKNANMTVGPIATITSSGASSYSILGAGMDGVAGIQLNISYDSASLADPTVTQGELVAGAMLVANTLQPGLIKIAIISTSDFSGSGRIAEISFASRTGVGGITSFSNSMYSISTVQYPAQASYSSSAMAASVSVSSPEHPISQATSTSPIASYSTNQSASTVTSTLNMNCR